VEELVTIALAGTIRWQPGANEPNGRWIQSRATGLMRRDGQWLGLRRAIVANIALLVLVAIAAVAVLVVAVAHGF
jgi:hypothetical protein